ncbi:hypothetical protein MTR_7g056520 [Medicago truncatula]|uniref:Uncharacterized protein n=1 Tax=Medicago truncatula TaxID=3880 RepID=A0A072TZS9_MEDTR|nr:hypothetical protein MTR_7g056520 [Medicago truncatula]
MVLINNNHKKSSQTHTNTFKTGACSEFKERRFELISERLQANTISRSKGTKRSVFYWSRRQATLNNT